MKNISAVIFMILMPFYSFADKTLATSEDRLACALIDLARGRIHERKQAIIRPQSSRPILMLMGRSPIMGTVRDFPGKDILNRKIELTLEYSAGVESGRSRSVSQYRLDQDGKNIFLAEAQLNGDFGQHISLRCHLIKANQ